MRFHVGQTLFAVHFGRPAVRGPFAFFELPARHDMEMPTSINIIKLTVAEHHKVYWEYDDRKTDPTHDGYLLCDDAGTVYANQYPHATYGQISAESNSRFRVYLPGKGELTSRLEQDPRFIYEYHLLSDVLEKMEEGIKHLGEIKLTAADEIKAKAREHLQVLTQLRDKIVAQFHKEFDSYKVEIAPKLIAGLLGFIRPHATIFRSLRPEEARGMSKDDFVQLLRFHERVDVVYPHGDKMSIESLYSQYDDGTEKPGVIPTIRIFYQEVPFFQRRKGGEGKSEHFPHNQPEMAVDCFYQRLNSSMPQMGRGMGMDVKDIATAEAARNIAPSDLLRHVQKEGKSAAVYPNGSEFSIEKVGENGEWLAIVHTEKYAHAPHAYRRFFTIPVEVNDRKVTETVAVMAYQYLLRNAYSLRRLTPQDIVDAIKASQDRLDIFSKASNSLCAEIEEPKGAAAP